MNFVGIFKLYGNSNSYTYTYCMILELQTASKQVTDLETKILRIEERQTEQNHGELLFIMIRALSVKIFLQVHFIGKPKLHKGA